MSDQRNPLEQVKRDAVSTARAGNPNLMGLSANFSGGDQTGAQGEILTRPGVDGKTIGPYIVDETPLDDPHFYIS